MKLNARYVYSLERRGFSEEEIAGELGISRMWLYRLRRRDGVEKRRGRSDKGIDRVDSGEKRLRRNSYQREYRRRRGIRRSTVRVDGVVRRNSRVVAERDLLGRGLFDGEVVHHINGDESDDRPENLLVFGSQGDHLAYHRGEDVGVVARYLGECHYCSVVVTLENYGIGVNGSVVCRGCVRF